MLETYRDFVHIHDLHNSFHHFNWANGACHYACRTEKPNICFWSTAKLFFFSLSMKTRRSTSVTNIVPVRRDEQSYVAKFGKFKMSMNMVGVPYKDVHLKREKHQFFYFLQSGMTCFLSHCVWFLPVKTEHNRKKDDDHYDLIDCNGIEITSLPAPFLTWLQVQSWAQDKTLLRCGSSTADFQAPCQSSGTVAQECIS